MLKTKVIDRRKTIGKIIAEARKSKGYSQSQLAIITDIDRTTISKIETGSWSFGVDALIAIAMALDIDVIRILPIKDKTK